MAANITITISPPGGEPFSVKVPAGAMLSLVLNENGVTVGPKQRVYTDKGVVQPESTPVEEGKVYSVRQASTAG